MSNIYKPPSYKNIDYGNINVFLAGSIEMGKAEDWQTRISDALVQRFENVDVYNPRRDDWDSSWEQKIDNKPFYDQVTWELNALSLADVILMYLQPETLSPISLLELGLHATGKKLIVCCPDGFWRKGNVDIVCQRYSIPVVTRLSDLFVEACTAISFVSEGGIM